MNSLAIKDVNYFWVIIDYQEALIHLLKGFNEFMAALSIAKQYYRI